jgi:hypothetical protein
MFVKFQKRKIKRFDLMRNDDFFFQNEETHKAIEEREKIDFFEEF